MSVPPSDSSDSLGTRLESWKQIAAYVNRHVTTVRRWEHHEGLPVHRHVHSTLSSVYAYSTELDAWLDSRKPEEPIGFPVAEVAPPSTSRRRHVPPPSSLAGVTLWPVGLLGRDNELEILRKVWHAASEGRQQIVVITSEAGQGKTRLAFEFARSIARQSTILTGVWDREALLPFAPFVNMLQWLARASDAATLQQVLSGIEGSEELAQLVPEIAKYTTPVAREFEATAESRRFRMFDAFSQLIAAISRECPTLLLFEDVHWADTGSLLFLRYLIRSTRNAPLCIVMTYRADEPDRSAFSEEILQDFQREFAVTRMTLAGLPADQVRRWVESWRPRDLTPGLADWIVESTEGNPLFITEMLTYLDEVGEFTRTPADWFTDLSLPQGIRHLMRRRFARLRPATRKLLALGAVIGREFCLPLIEVLAAMPEDQLLDAIEEALAANVLAEKPGAPGRFSFTHALLRETIYGDIMAARRTRLHYRIAEALERGPSQDELPLGELAYHFSEGAVYGIKKAIEYSVRAGDDARSRLALEDAARYYGMGLRALHLLPPVDANGTSIELHTLRGQMLFQAGQWAVAKAAFEAALNLLDPADVSKRCQLLVRLAEASFWLMDVPSLRQFASEAEVLADDIGRDDLWAEARAWMASAKVADGDVRGGIDMDRPTLARAGGIRSFALARIPLTLYWAGHTNEAAARAEEAVENARHASDPAFLLYALQHLGICLSGAGRYDEALRVFDEACSFGRQCGASSLLARAASMSVAPLLSLGEFTRATERAWGARELARRVSFEPPVVSAGIDLLLILARTHDPGRAESLLVEVEQAVEKASGWHAWKWKMRLSQARAELALAREEWGQAITFAGEVIEQSRCRNRPKYQALALLARARARRELGMRKAADDARASVDVARRLSDPALLVECLGLLLSLAGTDELLAESRRAIDTVLLGVTDEALQRSFLARARSSGKPKRSLQLKAASVRNYG